jgi:hypothetical protein
MVVTDWRKRKGDNIGSRKDDGHKEGREFY